MVMSSENKRVCRLCSVCVTAIVVDMEGGD